MSACPGLPGIRKKLTFWRTHAENVKGNPIIGDSNRLYMIRKCKGHFRNHQPKIHKVLSNVFRKENRPCFQQCWQLLTGPLLYAHLMTVNRPGLKMLTIGK